MNLSREGSGVAVPAVGLRLYCVAGIPVREGFDSGHAEACPADQWNGQRLTGHKG
jgi:hypothetical protein